MRARSQPQHFCRVNTTHLRLACMAASLTQHAAVQLAAKPLHVVSGLAVKYFLARVFLVGAGAVDRCKVY